MSDERQRPDDHLQDIPDGCGCLEVWEALSAERERRAAAAREEQERHQSTDGATGQSE